MDGVLVVMEKFCPACGRSYPDTGPDFCEDDGERLVNLNPHPDLIGSVLEGKYEIREQIGEGGMGTVYLAYQASMDREVAIKVLRPEYCHNRLAIKRFHREARAASRLAHPNTITVYDSGQSEDGLLYQVIELLKGKPLSDILEEEGPMDPHRAIGLVAQICDSLAEAHEAGITHRDLKPENIFVEEKYGNPEFVKVLDFGIAKIADANVTQATATGMICGTPSYMSPEQAMGRELDGRSDIYSLGVLFWELLDDKRPFEGNTPMEVMLKHINEPVPGVPEPVQGPMREALKDVFAWVMAKPPQARPQSCQELKARLIEVARACPAGGMAEDAHHTTTMETDALKKKTGLLNTGLAHTPAEATPVSGSGGRTWALIAAVLVVGIGGGLFALMGGEAEVVPPAAMEKQAVEAPPAAVAPASKVEETSVAEPTPPKEEAKPEPVKVVVRVHSEPMGASVVDSDGAVLGVTPLELQREKGQGVLEVTLKKAGYEERAVPVNPEKTLLWVVPLKKVEPVEAKTPRKSSKKAGRKAKGAKKPKKAKDSKKPTNSGKSGFGLGTF